MPLRDLLLALGVVTLWGLNFVTIKWGVDEVSPYLLTALRYIGCALPAVFFIRRPNVSWGLLLAYGMTVGVLQFSFLFSAVGLGMPAGLASLVMQMQVFFTMALAALLLGERPTPLRIAGAGLALIGLATIGSEHIGSAVLIPFLMTLVASLFWSMSNIVTKRAGKVDMFAFVIWGSLIPPLPMLAISLILEGPGPLLALPFISPQAIFSVLFIAYGSTLLGYGGWAILLGKYPAGMVAPFALLVPVVGFAAAFVFLGEAVTPLEMLGSLLIFAGLMLNVFGPRLWARLRVA
ncbi:MULTISPECIES: EamA family transporter [Devosia]|jgi:O-acetylserine/cysteine efflux transporter|uniref:EamA family transporter n=1 Tax=Devosia litorisediminis TaxID=2829817 RepID=A0A942I7K6_9HYPH|nr:MULTISPECIES: EamA family transporter [Devosia]MBS3850268.1 EamA family transporter [Devosia litorisediminis]MCZ4347301.1 EamA family transporter [Devosia neptuniae]|tara:strand:+ start:13054 stop:13929 length:876 start_codon:yes stop_codon:yes gene_type:complete